MDLAHTRWALQALADADQDPVTGDDPQPGGYRAKAKRLLRLLQKHPSEDRKSPLAKAVTSKPPYDGGFYFSPIVLAANKGRIESQGATKFFRSYATATCDGILALLAAGVPQNDPRVAAAHRWLEQHANWEYPQGIPRDHPEPWADAVFFYHQAVRAEVYRRLAVTGDWPEQLCQRLAPHLRPDGSIINRRSALMKEDDPLLGSTLALMAVTEARRAANGD
jgi:squalene-hopene/tetraprenyl-beta-curcumene cyclase